MKKKSCFPGIISFDKHEVFSEGKKGWKYSYKRYTIKENKIYRKTSYFDLEHKKIRSIIYYLGFKYHRLDGPADVEYYSDGKIGKKNWYVFGKLLPDFELYYSYNKNKKCLFEYAKDFPRYIDLIEKIGFHNNWLTEAEVLLLRTAALFS